MIRPVVIGLAGGIGSGKSQVARMLADLGCVVIDSDAAARAALERDDVRDTLRQWWGDQVFDPSGRVDRGAVASIVFSDPEERRRLEALIHPLVKASRSEVIARAQAVGVPAVVIDAPLLFEAGVNRECDAVIFVEAPETLRVERVRAARGWDDTELRRRESAQIPINRKREMSDHVINNTGDLASLRERVKAVLGQVLQGQGRPAES
jgi:dephospho-CoA kinase